MEYIIFAAVILLVILLLVVKELFQYKRREKEFIQSLYRDYGVLPQKLYKAERLESISHYYVRHREKDSIDDITWNDLNMDEVFQQMNYTFSAAGEEYLYYMLRTPLYDKGALDRREEVIRYFQTNAKERVDCQLLFRRLGDTGKFSVYDYLDYLNHLGERSNRKHYLALLLMAAGVGILFVNLPVGLVVLSCVFIHNILGYFKIKNEIDPYLTSFRYILKLTDMAEKLADKEIPVLAEENRRLKEACKSFSSFRRGSFLLMSGGRMSASSNPMDLLLDYLCMIFHLDLMQFNHMLGMVRKHIDIIDDMLTLVGEIEALIAVGAFRAGRVYCIPVFTDIPEIQAKNSYHPLIEAPVKNDYRVDRGVLITGSNASGKSTFLKTAAINGILAQTSHTCMADSYRTGFFRICSSMALRDDIRSGNSYYMAEIKSLKRILDMLKQEGAPVLCFVDEVLRGTNTVERIAASTQILRSLAKTKGICFAATHDIELTYLLKEYDNYHFEESIEENDISFSYKLFKGPSSTRNAIKLLQVMGYDDRIVKEAEKMAADFLEKGSWTC